MLPQHEAAHKPYPPSLLVDAMLGRLARWLRLLGYDAGYWRSGSDEELMQRAQAEGRLILTKDHPLAGRRGVWALLIQGETLEEQIAEVRAAFAGAQQPEPFTRCPRCNALLEELPREDARDLVPPYVWHTQQRFRRCRHCGRVYWKGTHYPGMRERLGVGQALPGADDEGQP